MGNGCRIHSLHLHFVTFASITFENANADVDAKCEWALTATLLHEQSHNVTRELFVTARNEVGARLCFHRRV